MDKKQFEIISSVGSVFLLTLLFAGVHQFMQENQQDGFVISIAAFIAVISVMGIKMATFE